ncbi:MAG: NADPH-dependent glutamate synthase, partial [Candidatus Hodarchaeales archaeon]
MKSKERMQIERADMPSQPPLVRAKNFREVPYGYTEDIAIQEANRCLNCKKPKCVEGCPVRVPIPEFISLIQEEKFLEAAWKIKETNVLPAVCGRVCPQEVQCEGVCIRGKKGKSVAIGNLERFVADYERLSGKIPKPLIVKKNGKKVAIIGSGPSGLTVAGDLIKLGYEVTVFEAFHRGGGVLVYGIPEFRLPKSVVEYEIQNLKNQGVIFVYDNVIGRIRTIEELFSIDDIDAVYIGVGAGLPVFMNIPGENLKGVYSSNEYLTRSNLMKAYLYPEYNTPLVRGKNVVVVGGGNVAMDSARTALRLDAKNVYIVYRRSREQMPARLEEVHHAEEEGIQFKLLSNPVEIYGDDQGRIYRIKCQRYQLGEPDKSGRARPVPIEGEYFELETDLLIISIGNKANPLITMTTPDLEINKWGNIVTDDLGRTSKPFVYAGGDIVTGAATVISAMGAGRRAATAIHEDIFPEVKDESESVITPIEIITIKEATIYPDSTIINISLINKSEKELDKVKISISHVQELFEQTLLDTTIPRWSPSEIHKFECPRIHENEKEYLLSVKDISGTLLSKIINAERIM